MPERIKTFVAKSLKMDVPGELRRYFLHFISAYGFSFGAYAVLVRNFRRLDRTSGLVAASFPHDLTARYFRENWQEFDPLAEAAMHRDTTFCWSEIEHTTRLTPEHERFFEMLRGAGLVDGVAAPVFGRYGDIGCFLLSYPHRTFDLTGADMGEIQLVCQFMHLRHSHLIRDERIPKLSRREREVARWIALGKSNTEIATILSVSPHTIDTIVRRYFLKLGVNNRVEAALKSVSLRLIWI